MKNITRFIIVFAITLLITNISCAASLYTVTINDTNAQTVQDAAIEIMTGKNFTIDEITPYKAVFTKSFGDGFWTATRICYVLFNFVERDGNVKLMVSETEKTGQVERKRGVDHLIPLVKKIKSAVDGTPEESVMNEAKNQLPGSGNEREKSLGLKLTKGSPQNQEFAKILAVDPGSLAAEAGILALDILEEINGRTTKDMTLNAINSYLANKMASKSSIMIVISRGEEKKLLILNQDNE
ncbi:MAG TPA: PDZ domain-containing protein [Synergistaceae bacterium]|nr:PDZ domain-containing protein [Synergistaceae bacterium]HPQ36071.1 PDZ domain-containing protein [Synergistaceae bacterium]